MKTIYTAIATSKGGREGHVVSSDGVLNFDIKKPKAMGGKEDGFTNPEQLFAAGYASCFCSALNHLGLLKRLRIESSVTAKVSLLEREDAPGFKLAVELDINIPKVEQKQAEELADEAHHFCPYSLAIQNNVDVKLNVTSIDK
ncbi:organic hydroperoxide resistance protein [Bacteroidales bacterium OttesenSCG-928-M11]|nr:organic hydroperoxide resistance protein [Bacteroidales bacterium OttesenSCG-928-M11]